MADAVIGLLIENLNSLIQRNFGLVWGVEQDISKLASLLSAIQSVLQDAEMREFSEKSIADWLTKLKDTAYDADDVLDEWLTYAPDDTCALACLSPNHITLRHRIAKKAKKIITRLDEIAGERSKLHLNSGVVQTGRHFDGNRETCSAPPEDKVLGRDADADMIVNMLFSNVSHGENISVLSIFGLGGLGKTTLAQLVYNDVRVVNHFYPRIWVCVSDDFDVKRLIKAMLESLTNKACDLKDLEPIQRQLQEKLSGQRFLLVLDDVWNEEIEKWHRLKSLLACGAKGSSILVTTRLETVASIMGTMLPLTFLSEDDCWNLFKGCAFGVGNEEVNADLVEIGKQIVRKCGGVPLAAKSLGGVLFSKREVNVWSQVRDSEIWKLPQLEVNGILPSLRLSYKYLPSNMKRCFAFCSIYPKDYVMKKEELIQLWMANGFVQSDGMMELEDAGNQVFAELLRRAFFQDIKKNEFGDIDNCKMHDLMHDLACFVSVNECCVLDGNKGGKFPKGIRHGSLLVDSFSAAEWFTVGKQYNLVLRTQLLLGEYPDDLESTPINLKKFYCLRALDLNKSNTSSIPTSVGRMIHLRYLNLSDTDIRSLPETICNLRNLQSLILTGCWRLKKLPKHMRKMSSLRHLEIKGCYELAEMPIGMGQLNQLHTLSFFVVGTKKGRHITELKGLNHLGGEIEIKGVEQVRNVEEAKEANLLTKQNITSLALSWKTSDVDSSSGGGVGGANAELEEKVLGEGLQPHPNLKVLKIRGFKGTVLPGWMGQLQNLVRVELKECKSCVCLPPLGKLPLLKFLIIWKMDSVKCIGDDFYGEGVVVGGRGRGGSAATTCWFPSLHQLEIHHMLNLEEWASPASSSSEEEENHGKRTQVFPFLKELTIRYCPKLKAIPCLPCVQNVKLTDCYKLEALPCLPCVQNVQLSGCHKLEALPCLPCVQNVQLTKCHKLEAISCLPCVQNVQLTNCHKLEAIPCLPRVQKIKLQACNEMILRSIPNLPPRSLLFLEIRCFHKMTHLPEGTFINSSTAALQSLVISECDKLKSLSGEIQNLTALTSLKIENCREMDSLSDLEGLLGKLTSLTHLNIGKCSSLKCLPLMGIQGFNNSLTDLYISSCENLTSVSKGLQYLTSLQKLIISDCTNLELMSRDDPHLISLQSLELKGLLQLRALPEGMQHLTMLKSLSIFRCYNLRTLPEWLQHLTSLQSLEIWKCHPDLYKRCERDKGDDWHIISHIPHLSISNQPSYKCSTHSE